MKFVTSAALLAAAAQAQNIDTLVMNLVNQIYQVSEDGRTHNFNIQPYFVAEYQMLDNGFKGDGEIGNGMGMFKFQESFQMEEGEATYILKEQGKMAHTPWANLVAEWAGDYGILGDYVDSTFKASVSAANGLQVENTGTINGEKFAASGKISMNDMQITPKKYTTSLGLSRSCEVSSKINSAWGSLLPPQGSSDIEIEASLAKKCEQSLLSTKCKATISATGVHNGEQIPESKIMYRVQKNKAYISVTAADKEFFNLSLSGIKDHAVYQIKYSVNGSKPKLCLQVAGLAAMEEVMMAFQEFIQPFANVLEKIMEDPNNLAHLIAYFDHQMNNIAQNQYFDFGPFMAATKLESECLSECFGVSSLQSVFAQAGEMTNQAVVGFCKDAAPAYKQGREYVQVLVSKSGEQEYYERFA